MGRPALVAYARLKNLQFSLTRSKVNNFNGNSFTSWGRTNCIFQNFGSGQRSRIELKNKSLKHHTGLFIFNYFFHKNVKINLTTGRNKSTNILGDGQADHQPSYC